MGLLDFFLKQPEQIFDPGSMSQQELNRQFSPQRWERLSYSMRCDCIRELENRFAREQGRPAKHVMFLPMEPGKYGSWSERQDCLLVNDTLVSDNAFLAHGRLIPQEDAPIQLYDTIAHESYHAYQSYALEHPEIHPDEQQLNEWRLNASENECNGVYESNYYAFDTDRNRYRIQALERDAFEYGNRKTQMAFDAIQAEEGEIRGYSDYLDSCEMDSYDRALYEAQERDPQTLSHMDQEMRDRVHAWQQGKSCGQIGADQRYYQSGAEEQMQGHEATVEGKSETAEVYNWETKEMYTSYEELRTMENPYDDDYEQIVHVRGYNSETKVKPSKLTQYQQGVQSLKEAFPHYQSDPQERQAYQQEIRRMQEELSYYPELDPRMTEPMKKYEGGPYEQLARDELGFYPYYEPNREGVFQKETVAEREDMEGLYSKEEKDLTWKEEPGEAEGEDMESLYAEEEKDLAREEEPGEAEGEDMGSLYAEEDQGETFDAGYSESESMDSGYSSDLDGESVDTGFSLDNSLNQ